MPDFQQVGAGAYKPGLERVGEFLNVLGRPQDRFGSVHVAGTNGKGSVSHMTAAVLQGAGSKTGLYTSPHLRDFRERIRIDGETITQEAVIDFAEQHLETMRALRMSFFEATMCMAFDWFARSGVDVAVVEAGLGGRLDSTNILTPQVSVITNIGLDHQQFLGETIAEIAAEKAGIIKRGVPVVVGEHGEADDAFIRKAAAEGAPLTFAQDIYKCVGARKDGGRQTFTIEHANERFEITVDLLGDYQAKNIVTLLAAVDALGEPFRGALPIIQNSLPTAAVTTGLRGRWEVLGHRPLIVADTAHNAHGIALVAEQLRGEHYEKLYIIIGVAADKDLGAILPLLPREAHYIFTAPSIARAMPAATLAARAAQHGLKGETVPRVSDALAHARTLASPHDMIFIGGSNFTVAAVI
jgi:dihydrofolate synthase/folylpolyglutamate synthase